ncbi:MAG: LysE family translocator [Candidatus Omnitrophota bacterium]
MSLTIIFYFLCYCISFLLGIPIGPVNLEIFGDAVNKQYASAISVAIGAAVGDGTWALLAFFGISPFASSPRMEAAFFLFTAIITFILGMISLNDATFIEKKEVCLVSKIKRKRWALLKGLMMVLINPLGIVSWMVCLQFLRKNGIFIPMELRYEIIFFVVVVAGVTSYFLLVVFITNRMKKIFNPERVSKITKFLGYLLLLFSLYFLYNAIKVYLLK